MDLEAYLETRTVIRLVVLQRIMNQLISVSIETTDATKSVHNSCVVHALKLIELKDTICLIIV